MNTKCSGAGDVLHGMVMDGKISHKPSPLLSLRWRKRDIIKAAITNSPFPSPVKKVIGHEILFRPLSGSEKIFPIECIGAGFGQMTENRHQMLEAYPILLKFQLEIAKRSKLKKSINLEYVVWDDNRASQAVFDLLYQWGHDKLLLEIKEDGKMPVWVAKEMANVCNSTGVRLYIDDLAMKVNDVPKNIPYFQMLIKNLGRFIVAIKVDYYWVSKMRGDPSVKRHISLNLHDFWYIWKSYLNVPLPAVIFESIPFGERESLQIIFNMVSTYGYNGCFFQSEEL